MEPKRYWLRRLSAFVVEPKQWVCFSAFTNTDELIEILWVDRVNDNQHGTVCKYITTGINRARHYYVDRLERGFTPYSESEMAYKTCREKAEIDLDEWYSWVQSNGL